MERSMGGRLLPAVLLVMLIAGPALAGDCNCKRWMGCGYGPGYNAPVPPVAWKRGCCEIPGSWRLHVWDGYRGDPWSYQRSMVGAYPDVVHMPTAQVYYGAGSAGAMGMGAGGGPCSNCPGGANSFAAPAALPSASPSLAPASGQPSLQSGLVRPAVRNQW